MEKILNKIIMDIRSLVGKNKVVSGLSGGIDSTVLAVLLKRAIGDQLTCVFIDTGLHRQGLIQKINSIYVKKMGLNVVIIDQSAKVLDSLIGKEIVDSRAKKDVLKKVLNDVFLDAVFSIKDASFLAHGTIKEDTELLFDRNLYESYGDKKLQIIEPFRTLSKEQVKQIGTILKIDEDLLNTHPLSAWGLSRKVFGEITKEKLSVVRQADDIFIQELKNNALYKEISNACVTLLPINSLANTTGKSIYGFTLILRVFDKNYESVIDLKFLRKISNQILEKVKGVTRVVFDITSNEFGFREWD